MASDEMRLFQQALWEATANVYERELAEWPEDAKCSRRHYAQMRKILGVTILPATSRKMQIKRRIVAALVAAVLLLTGCTTYAYREEIREFIETVFEDYIRVTYHDGEDTTSLDTISQYYTLGYVPDGYELTKTYEQPSQTKYKWSNSDGEYIILEQCHVDSALFVMDNEVEDWKVVQIGNHKMQHRVSNVYYYLWNDGVYAYRLTTSVLWEEQELLRIIDNLQEKKKAPKGDAKIASPFFDLF